MLEGRKVELVGDILVILGIVVLIITQKVSIYGLGILFIGVVLLLVYYTLSEIDFAHLIFQRGSIIGVTGFIVLSGVLIILLAEYFESLLVGAVVGSLTIYTLVYLYIRMHERYRSLRRRDRHIQERFPDLRQRQPPTQRRRRRPLRTKGFSEVNPNEYSKIPMEAVDPFVHDKIHDLITEGRKIMKCNECGVYFDKAVLEYFGKTCTRIGCPNKIR